MDKTSIMLPGGMLEGEELKRHLLNIADMALYEIITPEWDDKRKLNGLRVRVERLLRILKSVQGPWMDVSLQLRREREYYLLNHKPCKEKHTSMLTDYARCNRLMDTLIRESVVVSHHIEYHVWLERKIGEVISGL